MKYCTSGDSTKLTMLERLEASAPYNLFFNKISMSEQTHKQLYSIEMKGFSGVYLLYVALIKIVFRFIVS